MGKGKGSRKIKKEETTLNQKKNISKLFHEE